MKPNPFDRNKHVYKNDAFVELVKDAVRFFNGTPVISLPPPEPFLGTGVYALYYIGKNKLYSRYTELNRLSYNYPIYAGKAVPSGWRQARISDNSLNQSHELFSRLRQHASNVKIVAGLSKSEFMCRFVIFEDAGSDMIGTIEAAIIKIHKPLWNTVVDGFGNHDPGSGRYKQAKSDWDVIHEGRTWAEKCKGKSNKKSMVLAKIKKHFTSIG